MKFRNEAKCGAAIWLASAIAGCSSGASSLVAIKPTPSPTPIATPSTTPLASPSPSPTPTPTLAPVVMGNVSCTIPQPPGTFTVISTSGTYSAGGSYASGTNTTGGDEFLNSTYRVFMTIPSPTPSPVPSPTETPGPNPTASLYPSAAPTAREEFAGTYSLPAFSGASSMTGNQFSTAATTGCFDVYTYAEPIYGSPDNATGGNFFSTNSLNVTEISSGSASVQIGNITPVSGSGTITLDNGTSGTIAITGSVDFSSVARRPSSRTNSLLHDSSVWYRTRPAPAR